MVGCLESKHQSLFGLSYSLPEFPTLGEATLTLLSAAAIVYYLVALN